MAWTEPKYSCPKIDEAIDLAARAEKQLSDIPSLLEQVRGINADLRDENHRLDEELQDALALIGELKSRIEELQDDKEEAERRHSSSL